VDGCEVVEQGCSHAAPATPQRAEPCRATP
jgi:hypothetical protein